MPILLLLSCCDSGIAANETNNSKPINFLSADAGYQTLTLVDMPSPLIAGSGSYYDDGLLYYANSGCTIGFALENTNSIIDNYITYTNKFSWPSWMSFQFRASGFTRTLSPLEQNGYTMLVWSTGLVTLYKNLTVVYETSTTPFVIDKKYDVQMGTINLDDGVGVVLRIDGNDVINYLDDSDPLIDGGNFYTICADSTDGCVSAYFTSKKESVIPEVNTYTLSTLGIFPTVSGNPTPEVNNQNDVIFSNASQSVGFMDSYQNFALQTYVNITKLISPSNIWLTLRSNIYTRAGGVGQVGYGIRFASFNIIDIYKFGYDTPVLGSISYPFAEGDEFLLEVGIIDLSKNSTYIYISINNEKVLEVTDKSDPIQAHGGIVINPDGVFYCSFFSKISEIKPLSYKIQDDSVSKNIVIYLSEPLDKRDLKYKDFSLRCLESIMFDEIDVKTLNNKFYALVEGQKHLAVDVRSESNTLIVSYYKNLYDTITDQEEQFIPNQMKIKKTNRLSGFVSSSGARLKNTLIIDL